MTELQADEKILIERRRFWLPFAAESVSLLIAAVLPLFAVAFAGSLPEEFASLFAAYRTFALFLATSWFLVIWIIFFVAWTNYYLDVLLITTKRVVDIEQVGLFARDQAEMRIENIQDIKVEIVGVFASLLHFGNIHIQTAGVNKEFVIKNIHDPQGVKDAIMRQHDAVANSD
ncbi:MAG: PH domain-containing protein [Patescibacteria group bacterium]